MASYLLSVWHDKSYTVDFSSPEAQKTMEKVAEFNKDLEDKGFLSFGAGLNPAEEAKVFEAKDGEVKITDGSYNDSSKQVGGFWVIDVPDLETALDYSKKASLACGSPVELRAFQS